VKNFTVAYVISTLVLVTIATGLVSFFITSLNTNEFPPKLSSWISAWMLAWSVGTPIIFLISPFSRFLGQKLSDDPRDKD
jgi:hypothetical protein